MFTSCGFVTTNQFTSGGFQKHNPHPVPFCTKSFDCPENACLLSSISNNKAELADFTASLTGQFNNLVDENYWKIVDHIIPTVREQGHGGGFPRAREPCHDYQ